MIQQSIFIIHIYFIIIKFLIFRLAAHLIEQCKEDFRSTIIYVLIDYVHLLSKGVFISPILKVNNLNLFFLFELNSS